MKSFDLRELREFHKLNALHELAELCELLLVASKLLSHSIKTVVTLYWTE